MKRLEFKPEDFETVIHEGCECDLNEYDAARIAQWLFDKWYEEHKIDELERYHFISTGYKFDWE